jgi:hypothetical protein
MPHKAAKETTIDVTAASIAILPASNPLHPNQFRSKVARSALTNQKLDAAVTRGPYMFLEVKNIASQIQTLCLQFVATLVRAWKW